MATSDLEEVQKRPAPGVLREVMTSAKEQSKEVGAKRIGWEVTLRANGKGKTKPHCRSQRN